MPRVPLPTDFPPHLTLSITPPPSPTHQPLNVLLFLHGLGDTHTPFTRLATQLALPETVCLSFRAPSPLPFDLGGFHWGDDILFDDSATGAAGPIEYDSGFAKACRVIGEEVVQGVLVQKCGYRTTDIFILGLGQGGMVALALACKLHNNNATESTASSAGKAGAGALGGIISIGGFLPSSCAVEDKGKLGTPLLALGGKAETLMTEEKVEGLRRVFGQVKYVKWGRQGDGMPRSREEMMPVMRFLAERLRSRRGVPEGAVEVG
ncbi:MAG: hypothetical protein Q9167_002707 [Letrouitia subvulpina]